MKRRIGSRTLTHLGRYSLSQTTRKIHNSNFKLLNPSSVTPTTVGTNYKVRQYSNASEHLKTTLSASRDPRHMEQSYDLPKYLLNSPPTQFTVLPNKFRVASEYRHGETATVGVWIDAGSAWEDSQNNGVAHFLEHMAFKGTKTRTQEQIEIEIENMGGQLNAYTSREQTVYYAHVFKHDVPKAVEILSDILQNSKFTDADIERERNVILREQSEVETQPEEVVFDHLHATAFPESALGYTILGPEQNIRSIQRKDLLNYIDTHYTGPRMVLVGAGAVDHNQLCELANKHFGTLPPVFKVRPAERHPFVGSMVVNRNDLLPVIHAVIAMQSVPWTSPDYFAFLVIQAMVGSWDRNLGGGKNLSSRVCEAFAINKELKMHSLMSFNTCYHNTGLFGCYMVGEQSSEEGGIRDAVHTVLGDWARIATLASDLEVERAKTKLKASFLMQLDGATSTAEEIGRQILSWGRRVSPSEVFMRIDAIDSNVVRNVAQRYLSEQDPAVSVLGPADAAFFPDYHTIRGWTFLNRV